MYAPACLGPLTSATDGVPDARGSRRAGRFRQARALALALGLPLGPAMAHDTWFEALPARPGSATVLALGTGNRFPLQEYTLTMAQLQLSGCRAGTDADSIAPLQHQGDTPTALRLRSPWAGQDTGAGQSCWAQSIAFEIELPADKVALYLKEISAPPAVHAAWADLRARGLPWKERYSKHARIELPASGTAATGARVEGSRDADPPAQRDTQTATPARTQAQTRALALAIAGPASAAQPSGMAMDVLLESDAQRLVPGEELRFRVLRDGQPLRDLAVELHGDRSPLGSWKRTDAEGRVRFRLPMAGRWVLRGTDLRLSSSLPDTWESRFVTLAFTATAATPATAEVVRTAAP